MYEVGPARILGWPVLSVLLLSMAGACGESPADATQRGIGEAASSFGCGASFVMTVSEDDAEMDELGYDAVHHEEVEVCQSWNGSDYAHRVTTISDSDEWNGQTADDARTRLYSGGRMAALDSYGSEVAAVHVEPNLFDALGTPPEIRQASYDDPWYGITGGGGGGERCPDPTQINCEPMQTIVDGVPGASPGGQARGGGPLTRRGIRALLAGAQEIDATDPSTRRFVKFVAGVRTEYVVDRRAELILRESFQTDSLTQVTEHKWQPSLTRRPSHISRPWPNFVKASTTITVEEMVEGAPRRSRTELRFRNVRVEGLKLSN